MNTDIPLNDENTLPILQSIQKDINETQQTVMTLIYIISVLAILFFIGIAVVGYYTRKTYKKIDNLLDYREISEDKNKDVI
tara:strand:+ start:115 stop:357 length:243 start_codon:yes stop_codon:yes gene_type:complete